jgi:hypothetical protein
VSESGATTKPARSPHPRDRALRQGLLGVFGPVPALAGLFWTLERLKLNGQPAGLLLLGLALVAEVLGIWRLGLARAGRWDARGIAALVASLAGYVFLFLLIVWLGLGLSAWATGRPATLFGE